MFQVRHVYRGPTPEELVLVKQVYADTGILAVKDKETGKWVKPQARCGGVAFETPFQNVAEYGEPRNEAPKDTPGGGYSAETFLVRSTYVRFVGTKKFPKGLAIGGAEVWRQDNFFDDTEKFSCTSFRFDIWQEEMDRLAHIADDMVHVTDELWKDAEKSAAARRDFKNVTQMDPVGALTKAMAEVMAQRNSEGLDPETLAEFKKWRESQKAVVAK